jgi:flavorubredoxin
MAEHLSEGLKGHSRINVILRDIETSTLGDLESDLVLADALLIGSPTINQNTLLPVYKLISAINPLRDKSKPAGAFGSYGWSGEAPKLISDMLRNLKLRVYEEPVAMKFYPGEDKSLTLIEFGRKFADFVIAECDEKIKNPGS